MRLTIMQMRSIKTHGAGRKPNIPVIFGAEIVIAPPSFVQVNSARVGTVAAGTSDMSFPINNVTVSCRIGNRPGGRYSRCLFSTTL
jgi:hypothetical protein